MKQVFYFAITAIAIFAASCVNEPAKQSETPTAEVPLAVDSFYCLIKGFAKMEGGHAVMVDKVDFLTGDAAIEVARKAGEAMPDVNEKGDTTWSVANDYFISNPDMTTYSMPIASDATVNLLNPETGQPRPGVPLDEFVQTTTLHNFPYFMQVKDGKIVGIRMQWVP